MSNASITTLSLLLAAGALVTIWIIWGRLRPTVGTSMYQRISRVTQNLGEAIVKTEASAKEAAKTKPWYEMSLARFLAFIVVMVVTASILVFVFGLDTIRNNPGTIALIAVLLTGAYILLVRGKSIGGYIVVLTLLIWWLGLANVTTVGENFGNKLLSMSAGHSTIFDEWSSVEVLPESVSPTISIAKRDAHKEFCVRIIGAPETQKFFRSHTQIIPWGGSEWCPNDGGSFRKIRFLGSTKTYTVQYKISDGSCS